MPPPRATGGLRERKKQRTRQEISDVATRLFAERGFERTTLSEIAAAAEVSVKTIFNHFGSKEDLYFDRADEQRETLVATIAERGPGTTVLEALRELLVDNLVPFRGAGWARMAEPDQYERFRSFMTTEDGSPALRARRLTLTDELWEALGDVLARELGRARDDAALLAFVAMLAAAMRVRERTLRAAVTARLPAAEVRRRVVAVVEEAFGRLMAAYADVDRPR